MKRMKTKILLLGIFIITFVGVFPGVILAWPPALPSGQTLILVHGRGDTKDKMNTIRDWADPNVSPTYSIITWEKIYNVEYYGDNPGHPSEFNNVRQGDIDTQGATIEQFAEAFYIWLLGKIFSEQVTTEIYFICHSMGGLIIRYMLKHYYDYWGASIKGVAHLATPNHGAIWAFLGIFSPWEPAIIQMDYGSSFLYHLNLNDETPGFAKWYTYAGRKNALGMTGSLDDGQVLYDSVKLSGARVNRKYSSLSHEEMRRDWGVYTQVVYDFKYN